MEFCDLCDAKVKSTIRKIVLGEEMNLCEVCTSRVDEINRNEVTTKPLNTPK